MNARTLLGSLAVCCAILAVFTLAVCGNDDSKSTCPAKGIGVQSKSGTACSTASAEPNSEVGKDCRDQVENYKTYDCTEPQICVDQGKRVVPGFVVDAMATGQEVAFIITNCSTGNKSLNISKLVIAGDSRCNFKEPEIESKEIKPGQSVTVRSVYFPKVVGDDQAALHIFSDAQNYKDLVIPMCGRAVAKPTTAPDAGPKGDAGKTVGFDCQDVKTACTDSCHPNCKTSLQ